MVQYRQTLVEKRPRPTVYPEIAAASTRRIRRERAQLAHPAHVVGVHIYVMYVFRTFFFLYYYTNALATYTSAPAAAV